MRWPVGSGGVALAAGVAAVEGQEPGRGAGEPGRHLDVVGIDREVDERATREGHVRGIAVGPVLVLRVLDGLVRERVLELGRRDRDPVEEEREVERLGRGRLVRELAGDRQAVRLVERGELGREAVRGLEEREADLDAVVVDPVAEDVDRAALVELLREPVGELGLRAVDAAVDLDQALPGLGLGLGEEGEQLGGVEAAGAVEVGGPLGLRAPLAEAVPAGGDERVGDRVLEAALVGLHAATPGISSWPVTAAVMRAWRRSMRRSI